MKKTIKDKMDAVESFIKSVELLSTIKPLDNDALNNHIKENLLPLNVSALKSTLLILSASR